MFSCSRSIPQCCSRHSLSHKAVDFRVRISVFVVRNFMFTTFLCISIFTCLTTLLDGASLNTINEYHQRTKSCNSEQRAIYLHIASKYCKKTRAIFPSASSNDNHSSSTSSSFFHFFTVDKFTDILGSVKRKEHQS